MGKVIGIDLGTTNSVVAVVEGGEPVVIPNSEGSRTTPSVVSVNKKGGRLVGQIAKRQSITNPDNTIASIKRRMGKKTKVKMAGKKYTPQEVSAMVIKKLRTDAESYLGEKVTEAVITVPAYFEDAQRQATKDAGKIAGLEVKRIINEPTAAALAYGLDKDQDQIVLVFDLGGGTFDVSLLSIGGGVFEVKATSGNNKLGGDDFDKRVITWMADEFEKEHDIDLRDDIQALQRLKEAAEKAKIELSGSTTTSINIPFITQTDEGPLHIDLELSRAKFEDLCSDLIEGTMGPTKRALKDAKLKPADVDKILLVGGSTRIPKVQAVLQDLMGKEPSREVNPDECVAIGAAIQGAIMGGEIKKDLLLVDVTPLSLGVETLGQVMTKVINRNTKIPCKKSKTFSTAADNQTQVDIHVLQGERAMATDNKTLGMFSLVGIPPAPRGIPQIEVTFEIDVNGIVHVSAKDMATGNSQDITITGTGALSDEDIDRMVDEAESHEEEDKKRKERVDTINQGTNLVYATEKAMKDLGDKLDDDKKAEIQEPLDNLKKVLEDEDDIDLERLKKKMEKLTEVSNKIFSEVYAQAQQPQGGEGGAAPPPQEEEDEEDDDDDPLPRKKKSGRKKKVVDVDYEDVDD